MKRALKSTDSYKVLYINFSDDSTIDFDSYNESNIVNIIFQILNKKYSFEDLDDYGKGENVYLLFDNVKNLTILNIEKLKK